MKDEDYETIAAAVMETARGRWFLNEYARRNRASDTISVLDAVTKLENVLSGVILPPDNNLSRDVDDMGAAIGRLYDNLSKLRHETEAAGRVGRANNDLATVINSTEQATQQILAAAEEVQEAAWALRETGAGMDLCDKLDRNATNIYVACSLQEMTGRRVAKVVDTILYLEERIVSLAAMVSSFAHGAAKEPKPLPRPARQEEELAQETVDRLLGKDDGEPVFLDIPDVASPTDYYPRPAEEKKAVKAPPQSLPQIQAALASEWPVEEGESGLKMSSEGRDPTGFNLADYSFEEKLALFS